MLRSLFASLCLLPLSALADGEGFKVAEVFVGTVSAPNAHYIMLRAIADGQANVTDQTVSIYDYIGVTSYSFSAPLQNGDKQASILLATPEAEALFGVQADVLIAPIVGTYGSVICYEGIDCAAWSSYDLPVADNSTPFPDYINFEFGFALTRQTNNAGDPLVLDAEDDTNDGYSDWALLLPAPVNNAGQSGAVPVSTCGDFQIEGLEGCDDGNLESGDGCNSNCKYEPPTVGYCGVGLGMFCSASPAGERGSWGTFALFFGLFVWVGSRRNRSSK
jgi:cysteine-rich repeat protein